MPGRDLFPLTPALSLGNRIAQTCNSCLEPVNRAGVRVGQCVSPAPPGRWIACPPKGRRDALPDSEVHGEGVLPSVRNACPPRFVAARRMVLPLPKGEGRVRGKETPDLEWAQAMSKPLQNRAAVQEIGRASCRE